METVIHMAPSRRERVESGEITSCLRPGHRDYRLGPATIQFEHAGHVVGSPLDVYITEVVHTMAQERELAFSQALVRLGVQDKVENRATKLTWALL